MDRISRGRCPGIPARIFAENEMMAWCLRFSSALDVLVVEWDVSRKPLAEPRMCRHGRRCMSSMPHPAPSAWQSWRRLAAHGSVAPLAGQPPVPMHQVQPDDDRVQQTFEQGAAVVTTPTVLAVSFVAIQPRGRPRSPGRGIFQGCSGKDQTHGFRHGFDIWCAGGDSSPDESYLASTSSSIVDFI